MLYPQPLFLILAALLPAGPAAQAKQAPAPVSFEITFAKGVTEAPFTGRVFLVASKREIKAGPQGPNWFKPEPFFAQDVKNWKPGDKLAFQPVASFPLSLDKLPAGKYYVQAVMDQWGGQSALGAAGNGYSKAALVELDAAKPQTVALLIDQVVGPRTFEEKERVKLVDIPSKLLSAFHGKPIRMHAGVMLPKSWSEDAKRHYPVVYEIPGFGGTHFGALGLDKRNPTDVAGEEMIWVILDPSCPLGHHVFADSANNGPWGEALTEELIPLIEKSYRGLGIPSARFVTGHSSGGWSSPWLQVTYPDFFGGVWSTSPDPVDFRDFQMIDLYRPGVNMFTDDKGKPRPLARNKDKVLQEYKPFSDMEVVMDRGGQLFSFEAVFSPKGPDGRPMKLWDRDSGAVSSQVAKEWQRYDIRLILERDWAKIGPKLARKLRVYMGDQDTFYLEGATILLQKSLKTLGSDAVVEIFPGRNHGLIDAALRRRMNEEMAAAYRNGRK
ncbi:MAG: enterochelin esterase [Planctomycetes bacterium]|nr:enterochelin esterase [Planctomycetota bacterium]